MNFKIWLNDQTDFQENMWGNIPAKTRKPSDGWRGKQGAPIPMTGGVAPAMPKMMDKK